MTSFVDNFWGEKNSGYHVLALNLKQGQASSKDFTECLKELGAIYENHGKNLTKFSKSIGNVSQSGTFAPFWSTWKMCIDKSSSLCTQVVENFSNLVKDLDRYNAEQHKKHKTIKENEQPTLEAVQAIQTVLVSLHKARELYHTRAVEKEKLRRENASPKELEKVEVKLKKAHDEYKQIIEKYQIAKTNFIKKMEESCRHYQEAEEEHICQMKDFVDTYNKAVENHLVLMQQAHREFKTNWDELTVQKLIEMFVSAKKTGTEKPGSIEFVEPDLSALSSSTRPMSPEPMSVSGDKRDSFTERQKQEPVLSVSSSLSLSDSSCSPSPVLLDQPGPLSRSVKLRVSRTWFLKNKNKKKEKKPKKKNHKDDKDSESVDAESQGDSADAPQVDDEGYTVRPDHPMENNGDKGSWYSSDSDSDSDDDRPTKIKVEIRPLSPTAPAVNNVEDIRASIQGLSLSPTAMRKRSHTPIDKKMKRSQSESDTLDKPGQDLLSLDPLGSSSSSSTPTGAHYSLPSPISPLSAGIDWSQGTKASTIHHVAQSSPGNLSDLLSTPNGLESSSSNSPASSVAPFPFTTSTSTTAAIARPPSRNRVVPPVPPLSRPRPKGSRQLEGSLMDLSLPASHSAPDLKQKQGNQSSFEDTSPVSAGKASRPEFTLSRKSSMEDLVSGSSFDCAAGSSFLSTDSSEPVKIQNGPLPFHRSDSGTSSAAGFSTTSMPIGSSRGPSPLTIGMSDTIPLAVAFTDTIHAYFKGTDANKCEVKITGVVHISFPVGIIRVFTENPNPPVLSFRMRNVSHLEDIQSFKGLLSRDDSLSTDEDAVYSFDMPALKEHLRAQDQKSKAAYYNMEIIKYQVQAKRGVESTPLPLVVYWKCEDKSCEWRMDYRYNASAMSPPATLKNPTVMLSMPADVRVVRMQSHPINGQWDDSTHRATFKMNDISEVSEQESQGCIRAKFELEGNGPIKPQTTTLVFGSEGANLSGVDFELAGSGYRLSLTKKRFCTGKYYADPEPSISYV